MSTIKLKPATIIEQLEENREQYMVTFANQLDGYRKEFDDQVNKALGNIQAQLQKRSKELALMVNSDYSILQITEDLITVSPSHWFSIEPIKDESDRYDKAVRFVELSSVDKEYMILSATQYSCFIDDDWDSDISHQHLKVAS